MKKTILLSFILAASILIAQPVYAGVKDNVGGMNTGPVYDEVNNKQTDSAGADQILTGYSAWVNGEPVIGTMKDYSGKNVTATKIEDKNSDGYVVYIPKGYYDEASTLLLTYHLHSNASGASSSLTGSETYSIAQGCYTTPVYHTHGNSCYTHGHLTYTRHWDNASSEYRYSWDCDDCGRVEDTRGCHFTCTKSTSTVIYYKCGCGKNKLELE